MHLYHILIKKNDPYGFLIQGHNFQGFCRFYEGKFKTY